MNGKKATFTRKFARMQAGALQDNGTPQVEFLDTAGQVLAVLVGEDAMMCAASVCDHITEPRDPNDYSIEETKTENGIRWVLTWNVLRNSPRGPIHLGEVATQGEAEILLTHLKEAALLGWTDPTQ